MNRRNYLQTLSALFAVSALGCTPTRKESASQTPEAEAVLPQGMTFELPDLPEEAKNFYLVSDLGRNGYYEQKTIAELMGKMAEQVDIEFVVAAGDTHHFEGVASIDDPLWMTNYELVYSHPELMLEWFAVNGNHEYRGNTQAVLDYSKKSRRWIAPARYYAKVVEGGENENALLVFLMAGRAFDCFVVAVMGIGLELGSLGLHRITALMARHASGFFRNFTRLDVSVTGFARQIHRLMGSLKGHRLGGRCAAGSQKSNAKRGGTGSKQSLWSHLLLCLQEVKLRYLIFKCMS